MATNIEINPDLLKDAMDLGGFKTKREAVEAALEEFVRRRRMDRFVALAGTIDFDPEWDYKAQRRGR